MEDWTWGWDGRRKQRMFMGWKREKGRKKLEGG
jgi:hypothetical protein